MDPQFWHERWALNEIGFHQAQVNPFLKEFWPTLGAMPAAPVFVPLCGKSRDMLWLHEQGHPVLGVELSPTAVRDFFQESGLPVSRHAQDGFDCFESPGFQLYCGDFFALKPEHLRPVRAVFDRAALIALPEPLQARYVAHLLTLLPARPPSLLITLEYDTAEMAGPPFSVSEARVNELFAPAYKVSTLSKQDVLNENEGLKNRGLTRLLENAYLLEPRSRAD